MGSRRQWILTQVARENRQQEFRRIVAAFLAEAPILEQENELHSIVGARGARAVASPKSPVIALVRPPRLPQVGLPLPDRTIDIRQWYAGCESIMTPV